MKNVTTVPFKDRGAVDLTKHKGLAQAVAQAIYEHMRARQQADVMYWGFPWDFPPDPEMPARLTEAVPGVAWARAGHCDGGNPEWVKALSEVWPSWNGRPEDAIHVLNPRRHSPFHFMEGYFPPFSFRIFPIRAIRNDYTGIGRMGADYWDAWGGNKPSNALPDFGTKNLLWPTPEAMHSSQRLEILREGLSGCPHLPGAEACRCEGIVHQYSHRFIPAYCKALLLRRSS